ncbi:hypothetical protein DRQ53_14615, partial [bacterium]
MTIPIRFAFAHTLAALALSCVLLPSSSDAGTYSEDFSTTTYLDAAQSTADWNTGGGELGLFPFEPRLVGSHESSPNMQWIDVEGDYAFVTQKYDGLKIFDISDPTAPLLVGTYESPSGDFMYCVTVRGNFAYVGYGSTSAAKFHVLDVTNPTSPALVGSYDTPGNVTEIAIAGDLAHIADQQAGSLVLDISDPASPSFYSTYNPGGLFIYNIAATDSMTYAAAAHVMYTINPHNLLLPPVGSIPTEQTRQIGSIEVRDDMVFLGLGQEFRVIDVSNPLAPLVVGSIESTGAREFMIDGNFAYIADNSDGLEVIDISDPTNPTFVTSYDLHAAFDVDVSGNFAYVTDAGFGDGLKVIEVFHEDDVDPDRNLTQSSTIASPVDPILSVKLTSTQMGDVSWEITADGGANWQPVEPDGVWLNFDFPGSDLRWRSTQHWSPGVIPHVSGLQVDWSPATATAVGSMPGRRFALHPNTPNPFNPST